MDFLVIKKLGHGVITSTSEALAKHGSYLSLNLGREAPMDFGQQIEDKIKASEGKPLTMLIDVSDVDPAPYMLPLLDIVSSRRIAGVPLPDKSSIVIAMSHQGAQSNDVIPLPLAARTIRLDLTTPGFNPGPNTSPEGFAKLRENVSEAILNMVAVIHDYQGYSSDRKRRRAEPEAPSLI